MEELFTALRCCISVVKRDTLIFHRGTWGDTCSGFLLTLCLNLPLLLPPLVSCDTVEYFEGDREWVGIHKGAASFTIHIQRASESVSCWIQLLFDQRSAHSWGRYCFKAAGNDLSTERARREWADNMGCIWKAWEHHMHLALVKAGYVWYLRFKTRTWRSLTDTKVTERVLHSVHFPMFVSVSREGRGMGIKTCFQACSVTGKNIVSPCSQPDLQTLRCVFLSTIPLRKQAKGSHYGKWTPYRATIPILYRWVWHKHKQPTPAQHYCLFIFPCMSLMYCRWAKGITNGCETYSIYNSL